MAISNSYVITSEKNISNTFKVKKKNIVLCRTGFRYLSANYIMFYIIFIYLIN